MFLRKDSANIDMVSLILTVVIAAVTMMVGLIVVSQMETSMPSMTLSRISGSFTTIMTNTGTAFWSDKSVRSNRAWGFILYCARSVYNFLALGMFVLAATFIRSLNPSVQLGRGVACPGGRILALSPEFWDVVSKPYPKPNFLSV